MSEPLFPKPVRTMPAEFPPVLWSVIEPDPEPRWRWHRAALKASAVNAAITVKHGYSVAPNCLVGWICQAIEERGLELELVRFGGQARFYGIILLD